MWKEFPTLANTSTLSQGLVREGESRPDAHPRPAAYRTLLILPSLIAIMLGRLRMSTEEALQEYALCAKKIFSFQNTKCKPFF